MKKKIELPPSFLSPFTGDCSRQSQLNRSVDGLLKSRTRRGSHQLPKPVVKAGEAVCTLLFFVCLIGCAYGVMAL